MIFISVVVKALHNSSAKICRFGFLGSEMYMGISEPLIDNPI